MQALKALEPPRSPTCRLSRHFLRHMRFCLEKTVLERRTTALLQRHDFDQVTAYTLAPFPSRCTTTP